MKPKYEILVVDDDHLLCKNLKEHLKTSGYQPTCAFSGMEAVGVIKERDFHLVLTDLEMPYIDGFGLIKFIKTIKSEIPVILMTGDGEASTKDKALELGASEFIRKPFNIDHLLRVINKVLSNNRY